MTTNNNLQDIFGMHKRSQNKKEVKNSVTMTDVPVREKLKNKITDDQNSSTK